MDFFYDIARYAYLHNALAACILSGIACGIMGTYVVCRRTVFLAGGITHASFGGLGIAFYLGLNPIAGALVFAVLSALGIEWAGNRGRIREDSAIGIIWSVGMAPVSYTHLDVYKRQAAYCNAAPWNDEPARVPLMSNEKSIA